MASDIFDGIFEEMHRRIEAMFSNADGNVTTYGYSVYQGPEGVPHVQRFGNAGTLAGENGPITDVVSKDGKVIVTMEFPGIKKEDISLEGSERSLTVSVRDRSTSEVRKRTVALPNRVDTDSAVAFYNNGILEITLDSVGERPESKRIEIR